MKIIVLLIILNGFASKIFSQNPYLQGVTECNAKINYEKHSSKRQPIRRVEQHTVTFQFFQDFSDSVQFFVNGNLIMDKLILHDSTLVSTDYTGTSISYNLSCKKNRILIKYKYQNIFLTVEPKRKYLLYTIHVYRNSNCLVAGRKYELEIK